VPIFDGQTGLDRWVACCGELGVSCPAVVGNRGGEGLLGASSERVRWIEDSDAYRGPGGVLRDSLESVGGSFSTVVVIEAMRWYGGSIRGVVEAHRAAGVGATVTRNPDGTSGGVFVAEREAIDRFVPRRGFFDLKEQWLGRVRDAAGGVGVSTLDQPGSVGIAGREGLIVAMRRARGLAGTQAVVSWPDEGTERAVEVAPGAAVDPAARLADSIVMDGAVIESGAVVARSVIGPGVRVGGGRVVVDGLLGRAADAALAV
jgi:NDP-sugar pyrophosphorylase family protein